MARLALFVAILAVSFAAPFVHLASPAPGLTVAALRVSLAALLLNLAAPTALRRFAKLPPRERWLLLAGAAMLGLHFGVWISSLRLTSTASSVTLVALQPVFAGLLGARLLGEGVSRRAMLGIGIAVLGTAVLAGADWRLSSRALFGDLLALVGAAFAASYLVVGRSMRVSMPLLPYLALVNLFATPVLFASVLLFGQPILGFSLETYGWIAASALIPSLLGHTLLNWSVRRTPAHMVTLAILGEPVGATLLSWAIVSETPPLAAAFGGGLILIGIGVGFTRRLG